MKSHRCVVKYYVLCAHEIFHNAQFQDFLRRTLDLLYNVHEMRVMYHYLLITYQCVLQIWCWSCHNGAALLKMSAFPKDQDDSTSQMQKIFLEGLVITVQYLWQSLPCSALAW